MEEGSDSFLLLPPTDFHDHMARNFWSLISYLFLVLVEVCIVGKKLLYLMTFQIGFFFKLRELKHLHFSPIVQLLFIIRSDIEWHRSGHRCTLSSKTYMENIIMKEANVRWIWQWIIVCWYLLTLPVFDISFPTQGFWKVLMQFVRKDQQVQKAAAELEMMSCALTMVD